MRRADAMALMGVLAVLLAACTRGGPNQTVPAPRIEVTAAWGGTQPGSEQDRFMRVLDEFTRQTGVVVHYTTIPGPQMESTLNDRVNHNSVPDVALLPQPGLLRDYACRGLLKPLPPGVQQAVTDNYTDERRAPGMIGKQLYGVWFKAANKSLIWYNAPVLQRAGIGPPPSTWPELLDTANKIAASGVTPLSVAGAPDDAWVLTDWFENVYLRTAGPDLYDRLAEQESPRLPWTDPSVTTALERLAELWAHQPSLIVGATEGALNTTYPQSVANVFTDKSAAMVFEGDFVAALIPHTESTTLGKEAQFFPFPSIDNAPDSVIAAGDVAVMMKDNPGARQLLTFLATPAAAEIWASQGGFISPNKNVPVDVYPDDKVTRPSARAWADATVVRFDLSDQLPTNLGSNPRAGLWKELWNFLQNPADIADFGTRMEAAATLNPPSCVPAANTPGN